MTVTQVSCNKSWGGYQKVYQHESVDLKCSMKFGVYFPPQYESKKCPVLLYLSGLTCTEQNVVTKGGFQQAASQHGIVVVAPDTSPRGCNISGEDDSYDFGSGAGFYVDATEEPWSTNYKMFSYVTSELPNLLSSEFTNVDISRCSIFGHSMGGHGALVCALKQPGKYKSVSAFSPIVNPINCPWGQKAFNGYLGPNVVTHKKYDACCLAKDYSGPPLDILIDQGTADQFLEKELLTANFTSACKGTNISANARMQDGYDHSYFFISTFMSDHVNHHAKFLMQ